MLVLDTSGIVALLVHSDADHAPAVEALEADAGPYVVPALVLAEAAHMLERRGGARSLDLFLADIEDGAFTLDCGEEDLGRIRELALRYRSLPLGFADAAVIACAERRRGAVLTLDRRDFPVVAAERTLRLLPD